MWTDYYSSLYSSEIQSRSVYSNALPGFWTHRQCSRQAEYRGLTTGVLSCSVVSDSMEWVPISYSKGSSRPKDRTHVSCISCVGRWSLFTAPPGKALQFRILVANLRNKFAFAYLLQSARSSIYHLPIYTKMHMYISVHFKQLENEIFLTRVRKEGTSQVAWW